MKLAALIRGRVATAIPAIPATAGGDKGGSVARIAKIAVATPSQEREIRHLLTFLLPGADHPDFCEALALALGDPGPHLEAFRTSR